MEPEQETPRDLAAMVIGQLGRLVATNDRWMPYRLVDENGVSVEAVSAWFAELLASGRAEATVRSYGLDLLRWFRFCWAVGLCWDRATRTDARDFSRWLQLADKPTRAHWRHPERVVTGAAGVGRRYSAAVRAHSETVLRAFYDFHRDEHSGPALNPFPLDRSRRGGRAHAHHNPMEAHRNERVGGYRPKVATRIPRAVPDAQFNEMRWRVALRRMPSSSPTGDGATQAPQRWGSSMAQWARSK